MSPLKKYVDHLNAGIGLVLALTALNAKRARRDEEVWLAVLAPVIFLLIYAIRTQLKPVDVNELEKLKYGYKGA